jgi:hypothetical protein
MTSFCDDCIVNKNIMNLGIIMDSLSSNVVCWRMKVEVSVDEGRLSAIVWWRNQGHFCLAVVHCG